MSPTPSATPDPALAGAVVAVTGAEGGIGSRFVRELLARGVGRIHACALRRAALAQLAADHPERITCHEVDLTDAAATDAVAARCGGTSVVIHCAGIELKKRVTDDRARQAAQLEMAVNFHGTVNICTAFLPVLRAAPRAWLVNLLSIASLAPIVPLGAYNAAKAAAHAYTLCLREELRGTSVTVHGVYPGWIGTGMGDGVAAPTSDPADLVRTVCDELVKGTEWIIPDPMSQRIAAGNPGLIKPPIITGMH